MKPRSLQTPIRVLIAVIASVASQICAGVTNSSGSWPAHVDQRNVASRRSGVNKIPPAKSLSSGATGQDRTISPQASTGTTLFTPNGSGAGTVNGDYVSAATGGLSTYYRFFIEVPPGLGRLVVELFDPDIGLGGTAEAAAGRDRARNTTFDTAAAYTLIDPAGSARPTVFATGNSTQPTGADNAWLAIYNSNGNNVLDTFSSVSYSNNNGNHNWSAPWIEVDSGGAGPNSGAIAIVSGQLRVQDSVPGTPSIEREVNLSAAGLNLQTAFLNFTFSGTGLIAGDALNVQISSNGGASYTTLETLTNTSTGTSRTYNITSFISATTRVRFIIAGGLNNTTNFFSFDNVQIYDGGPITAGHWELHIDTSSAVTSGDDINAIGIRAHDGTSGSGGTELNVYADSIVPVGVNPPASGTSTRSYTLFPYLSSGCSCSKNDFDFDSNNGNTGSLTLTSRSAAFTQSFTSSAMSADNAWRRDNISGWTSDSNAVEYGIWQAGLAITSYLVTGSPNGNYGNFYMSNFQAAANPPTANPVPNAFRLYLPTDAGNAPVKPYVEQLLTYAGPGPNPMIVNQTTTFAVTVRLVNPTSRAITFSAANLVTANIPGGGALYGGNATVGQGSIVSQPAVNGTGNVTWNPGTLAAGATAILAYRVKVTPTSAGQRIPVTATPASGNGTRAQFVDETGNATQARATFLFGPLCELAVTQGSFVTEVELASFKATGYEGGVSLQWETGFEVDNLGFRIHRDEAGKRVPVTEQIIAGSALVAGPGVALGAGRSYAWWDSAATGAASYWLEEIATDGRSTWHGPFAAKSVGGPPPRHSQAQLLSEAGRSQSKADSSARLERTAVISSTRRPSTIQSSLPVQPAIKISVRHEGWYRVTQPELVAAGFDPGADARLLQMFVDGQPQPIKVIANESGQFDSSSAVEFYGMGLDTAATDTRIYWLVVGSGPGLRIQEVNGSGLPSSGQSFTYTVERKDRSVFFFSLKNGEKENFFGPTVSPVPVGQALTVEHLDAAAKESASLEVALQGATLIPHLVRVQLNGEDVGSLSFDGQAEGVVNLKVDQSSLIEGTNQVTLTAQSGESDFSFVDYVRLSYWHLFTADDDALQFTTPGKKQAVVAGFTSASIRVLDVTDPTSVQELKGQVEQQGSSFAIKVTPVGDGQRTLLALANSKAKSPSSLSLNRPSTLASPANGADLIIISHRDFLSAVEPLAALRKSQGLKVAVVDVEDVYDEFSYGQKSSQAVRDFLSFAKGNWKRPPRFVLLVGNASRDPRNYVGFGDLDFVPTRTIDTSAMETASDDWFVDFDGDGLSEMPIGRLPVRTPEQLSAMISKIIGYEQAAPSEGLLLFADTNSGFDFGAASAALSSLLPPDIRAELIDRNQTDAATARARLLESIGRGQKLVNYTGHGSATIWKDYVLTVDDAEHLNNDDRLALFVMMTCLNGYFLDPGSYSLAEGLMKAERVGAVAVWASSGMTSPQAQTVMNQQLFRLLFSDGQQPLTLGEATARAKASADDLDVRRTWILFGDPTTRLR